MRADWYFSLLLTNPHLSDDTREFLVCAMQLIDSGKLNDELIVSADNASYTTHLARVEEQQSQSRTVRELILIDANADAINAGSWALRAARGATVEDVAGRVYGLIAAADACGALARYEELANSGRDPGRVYQIAYSQGMRHIATGTPMIGSYLLAGKEAILEIQRLKK